jgi:hypothetical protein
MWNTQYRRPPTFHVAMPVTGQFKVKTSNATGTEPRIAIYLDGNLVLQQTAQVNSTYSINVPAGKHSIRVDNTGTDWITISSYAISELGKAVDAYVLRSETKDYVAGWALNKKYNHQDVVSFGLPSAVSGTVVTLTDMTDGVYRLRYYSPLTGALLRESQTGASGGILNIPLEAFVWDIAFIAEKVSLNTAEKVLQPSLNLYPNPVLAGRPVCVEFDGSQSNTKAQISLLDASGKCITHLKRIQVMAGEQKINVNIPENLGAGMYWLRLEGDKLLIVSPLMISK